MFAALNRILSPLATWKVALMSITLIAVLGYINYLNGTELSFSIFYLLPVAIAAWYTPSHWAIFICVASAATWLAVDLQWATGYSHPAIPFWNGIVRFGFFSVVAHLLQRLHSALNAQEALAQRDGLTGLLNALSFRRACDTVFDLAARHERPVVLGYLDVDGFKSINDTLGHGVGDKVLQAIATTLSLRLRASDQCARLGGDEFAVVLPVTDEAGGRAFFTELHKNLQTMAAQAGWPIGFSIGVGVFEGRGLTSDEAIRLTDQLMYQVKQSGKNAVRVAVFKASDLDPAGQRSSSQSSHPIAPPSDR